MIGNEAYCTDEDRRDIAIATTFAELEKVAERILARMPRPVIQVCGRISSGGGTIEENCQKIALAVAELRREGKTVFAQIEFEDAMARIRASPHYRNPTQILEAFYLPLFQKRFIQQLIFLPGWESSFGATWEHEIASRLGIEVEYWHEDFSE
jgi:hypothetical protein